MSIRVVRVHASPLVILTVLERARAALDLGDPELGRVFVDDAIRRLEAAKTAQDAVLDEDARTPEQQGTPLDLSATA
jgi:hypothetical protein